MTFAMLCRLCFVFVALAAASKARLRRATQIGVVVLVTLLGGAATAYAQGASEAALADGHDALDLYNAGKHAQALELFARAEAQYHTPVFVLFMARCQRELDQLLEARATFATVIAEDIAEDAPPPWHRAREEAKTESDLLAALIPKLLVTLEGAAEGATLTIDGKPHPPGIAIELNPGSHEVRVRRDGAETTRTVEVTPGVIREVVLSVRDVSVTPAPPPTPGQPIELPPPGPTSHEEPSNGLRVAGYLLSGLGVLGVTAGVITGVMALSANDAAGEGCNPTCPVENKSDEDRAFTLSHAATGSFIAGGAALGVGIILLVVSLGADDPVLGSAPIYATPQGVGLRF